jgi:hypothetical protein
MGRRLGRQRGKAWWPASSGVAGVSPYEEKRGGGGWVWPAATWCGKGGGPGGRQRCGNDGRGDGRASSALRHAEEKGKMLGHPGKERKEVEEGVQPSDTRRGHGAWQRPGAGARSACDGEGSGGA